MTPIIPWVGGKRALVPHLIPLLPPKYKGYLEPFVGSGALFFALQGRGMLTGREIVLSDLNPGLVLMYQALRDRPDDVYKMLRVYERRGETADYYAMREAFNRLVRTTYAERYPHEVGAMFLYLMRRAYNGLCRMNQKGEMNAPRGSKRPAAISREEIFAIAEALQPARIFCGSYATILRDHTQKGDFVYLDPPYDSAPGRPSFTAYTAEGFDRDAQEKLYRIFCRLDRRGCKVMLSNARTKWVRRTYAAFDITKIYAPRKVAADPDNRNEVLEYVIRNYT